IEVKGDILRINPQLPEEMKRLDLRIRYRGHSIDLRLTRDTLTVRGHDTRAAAIKLGVGDEVYDFTGGTTRAFKLDNL
ncbi:MAG: hypothetical protein HY526_13790, partial [Betaproteobacteria bacterium]|nr:hypothetical protein [Betaproteobacteria bacterium]